MYSGLTWRARSWATWWRVCGMGFAGQIIGTSRQAHGGVQGRGHRRGAGQAGGWPGDWEAMSRSMPRRQDPVKAVLDLTQGRGADVVVEAAGSESSMNQATGHAETQRHPGHSTAGSPQPIKLNISRWHDDGAGDPHDWPGPPHGAESRRHLERRGLLRPRRAGIGEGSSADHARRSPWRRSPEAFEAGGQGSHSHQGRRPTTSRLRTTRQWTDGIVHPAPGDGAPGRRGLARPDVPAACPRAASGGRAERAPVRTTRSASVSR